jgi:RXT2-like, N-terminal
VLTCIAEILAPLESAADLPSHPSLSHIYTSRTLNDLLQQSLDKLCEEQAHTVKLKNLLTVFLGDDPFINLEKMEWPEEDFSAIARERSDMLLRELGGAFRSHLPSARGSLSGPADGGGRKQMVNGELNRPGDGEALAEDAIPTEPSTSESRPVEVNGISIPPPPTSTENPQPSIDSPTKMDLDDSSKPSSSDDTALKTEPTTPPSPPRRMTTRSTHNSHPTTPPSASPAPVEIDPWFFPPNYRVDPNFGLPPSEAADTRHLLATAVQRQDEFLRGLNKVRDGLSRAERFRKLVWGWCRAMEGTRDYLAERGLVEDGIMNEEAGYALSDGEDYYDAEQWGLEEPLEKGREEEEEGDVIVGGGKKTRGRVRGGN